MASLTNVKNSWSGANETIEAIPPYIIPMGTSAWLVYTDLRQEADFASASTVTATPAAGTSATTGDTITLPDLGGKIVYGIFPFEYSVADSTGVDTASAPVASYDATTDIQTVTLTTFRASSKNRVGCIVVVR